MEYVEKLHVDAPKGRKMSSHGVRHGKGRFFRGKPQRGDTCPAIGHEAAEVARQSASRYNIPF
jgi:hypothetical protein